jgi:hypothetical protein
MQDTICKWPALLCAEHTVISWRVSVVSDGLCLRLELAILSPALDPCSSQKSGSPTPFFEPATTPSQSYNSRGECSGACSLSNEVFMEHFMLTLSLGLINEKSIIRRKSSHQCILLGSSETRCTETRTRREHVIKRAGYREGIIDTVHVLARSTVPSMWPCRPRLHEAGGL